MNENDKNTLCRQIVETVGDAVIFADRDGITARWIREKELHRRMAFLEAGQTTL